MRHTDAPLFVVLHRQHDVPVSADIPLP
jgi:hypothetical protein